MMWGRPIKTHTPGGATLPLKIFVRSMGLICFLAFVDRFALTGYHKTPTTQAIKHIYICLSSVQVVRQSVRALSCIMYARICVLG